ncbi:hypothetical protein UlMin_041503 [Ulmus minor]
MQAGPQNVKPLKEEASEIAPGGKRLEISLQIPPRPTGFGSRSGKGLLQSQGSANGSSSKGGFLRCFSFKKKGLGPDGEKSSLLDSDACKPPESPIMANLRSAFAWQRCASLPVRLESNLSPAATPPLSARMPNERQRPHKGATQATMLRSLSVVIVRSLSFANHSEHAETYSNDDQITLAPDVDDEEIPEEEVVCRICLEELKEGNTLKMECSSKGASNSCAKHHEVKNLLVTLLRMQSSVQRSNRQEHNQESMNSESIRWVNYGLGCSWFLSQFISLLKLFQIVCSCFFLNIFIAKSNRKQQHTDEAELPNRNQIAKSFQLIRIPNYLEQLAKIYVWEIARLHGVPVLIISHRDSHFTSSFWKSTRSTTKNVESTQCFSMCPC